MSVEFSVILPTYNRSKALRRCLTSLLYQSFDSFEVVISDDGSTDSTLDVVKDFQSRLNLIYIYNKNTGGPACPRNLAINKSNGSILAFLDSDDWWLPSKLQSAFDKHTEGNDIVCHDMYLWTGKPSSFRLPILRSKKVENTLTHHLINKGNPFINSSITLRKSILGELRFDPSPLLTGAEDFDLWIKLSLFSPTVFRLSQPLGFYSLEGDNISNDKRSISFFNFILSSHANIFKSHDTSLLNSTRANLIKKYIKTGHLNSAFYELLFKSDRS